VRRACQTAILEVRRDLRFAESELLHLYRSTGKRPPKRLTEHIAQVEQQLEDPEDFEEDEEIT